MPICYVSVSLTDCRRVSQNFIICVEMAAFAIGHHWFFSYTDFLDDFRRRGSEGPVSVARGMLPLEIVRETVSALSSRPKTPMLRAIAPLTADCTLAVDPALLDVEMTGLPGATDVRGSSKAGSEEALSNTPSLNFAPSDSNAPQPARIEDWADRH